MTAAKAASATHEEVGAIGKVLAGGTAIRLARCSTPVRWRDELGRAHGRGLELVLLSGPNDAPAKCAKRSCVSKMAHRSFLALALCRTHFSDIT